MRGVVLGNGPSKDSYDRSGDLVIGCNFPGDMFSVDCTVICDEEIVYILKNNPTAIQCPLIISQKVFSKLKEYKIVDRYTILSVFKPKQWYNSGHYAAEYLIQLGCEQIDIWGCDSIFSDTIESTTDAIVQKEDKIGTRFLKNWRKIWNDIITSNENIQFSVYRYR